MKWYKLGKVDDLMLVPIICETYGWTYEEFLEQPLWFIRFIKDKLLVDNKKNIEQLKKTKKR